LREHPRHAEEPAARAPVRACLFLLRLQGALELAPELLGRLEGPIQVGRSVPDPE